MKERFYLWGFIYSFIHSFIFNFYFNALDHLPHKHRDPRWCLCVWQSTDPTVSEVGNMPTLDEGTLYKSKRSNINGSLWCSPLMWCDELQGLGQHTLLGAYSVQPWSEAGEVKAKIEAVTAADLMDRKTNKQAWSEGGNKKEWMHWKAALMNPTGGVERGYHAAFIRLFYSMAETSRGT